MRIPIDTVRCSGHEKCVLGWQRRADGCLMMPLGHMLSSRFKLCLSLFLLFFFFLVFGYL